MNKAIIWAILFCLLISTASAAELVDDPPSCANTHWYSPNTWFPCLPDKWIQQSLMGLYSPAFEFETMLTKLSVMSFDAADILPYWAKMNLLAGFLLALVVFYTGVLFMFSSFDSAKRTKAKIQLKNIFKIILLVNLSLILAVLILEIANAITSYLWTTMLHEEIATASITDMIFAVEPVTSLLYFIIFLVFGIPFLVKIIIRIILLLAFLAAMPLLVTFYYFLPTQDFARGFVKMFFVNAFFPVIWILVFFFGKILVTVIGGGAISEQLAQILVFAGALYINNHLYKKLALNFSLKDAAMKIASVGATIWKTAKTIAVIASA